MEPVSGRRFLVTMAVDRYQHLPEEGQLKWPSMDGERIGALLSASRYRRVLTGLGGYSTVEHVKTQLSGWSKDVGLGQDDAIVFYYAGHGVVEDRDRHYLMCWSSDEDDPATTALPTEDLIRILTRTGLRNLLVILDTCYGGAGAADGAQLVLRTIARKFNDVGSGGVWLLSSARSKDEAKDGAFVDCLLDGLADVRERTGQRQRYLDLSYVVEAVNRRLERLKLRQRAELAAGMVTGVAPFLDNEGYQPGLPSGDTDLALQRRWARGELHDHFGPRARGVEFDSEPGLYFSGRNRVLGELVGWLTGEGDDVRGRVVTGSPGCGKSAVLGRIVAMSDPTYRKELIREADPAGAGVTPRLVDVWVHARHQLLPEIVERIAADLGLTADSPGQLLRAVSHRANELGPIVIVVDALDEAGAGADSGGKHEPRRIARELLRPLSEISGVRLLVGTRRELVGNLGKAMKVLDLDDPVYLGDSDLAGYVSKVLLAENEPEVSTPYRGNPELARQVGEAVSCRASGLFLVARMTARGLRSAEAPVDVTAPGWQDKLPSEIGQAFEDYFDRYGQHRTRVRAMLTPLAFAEGQGLPRGALWNDVAAWLADRYFGEEDIDWLLDEAGDYIAEVTDNDGHSVYRLYHQSLAEHLRTTYPPGTIEAQSRIVDAFLPTVTRGADGAPDWFAAHRYLRAHLATHAAAAGRLGELAEQPGFLLVAEQLALLKAFATAGTESAGVVRSAYEQAAHQLVESIPLGERAAYLQLSARQCGAQALADQIDEIDVLMPWRTRWAWWSPTGAHQQLIGHEREICAVTTGSMDGRAVAVTGGADGTARVWDLITRRPLGEPLRPGGKIVTAVAIGEMGDYTILVTGGADGRLRVWDLSTGKTLGEPLEGHTNRITSIVVGVVEGETVAISASRDGTARVWELPAGLQRGVPFGEHRSAVHAVSLAELDGTTIVLSGGADNRVHAWDIGTQKQLGEALIGHIKPVMAVATHGRMVVTGSEDGTIGLWDLHTHQQLGEPLAAHEFGVRALAVGELKSVPVAVSCGQTVAKVWNLDTRRQLGQPLAGHINAVVAVAVGSVDRTPVAITGGFDRTARIWDLNADQPLAGHTDRVISVAIGQVDGRFLAVTGSNDTTAVVWDLGNGGLQDGPPLAGHRSPVAAVALGELGGRSIAITSGEDALVQVWDLESRQPIGPVLAGHTGPVMALDLGTIDGVTVLVTGSRDGTVRLWDPATGIAVGEPLLGHNADVECVFLSKVENCLLVFAGNRFGHVTGWDFRTRRKLDLELPDLYRWRLLAIGNADGRPIAVFGANDNSVLCWDILTNSAMGAPLVGHTDFVESAVIGDCDGRPVALTASRDLTVRTWDIRDGTQLGVPLTRKWATENTMAIGPMGDETAAIVLDREQVRLWSLRTFQQVGEPLYGAKTDTNSLAIGTANGQAVVVCGCNDGQVRVRDLDSGRPAGPLLNGHWGWVRGCVVTELDGPVAVTAEAVENTVRVWDLTSYWERFKWMHAERSIFDGVGGSLALCRCDGRPRVITTTKALARVWELSSRSLLGELSGHTANIAAIAAIECGGIPMVLTGSRDSTARLWNLRTFEPVCAPLTGHKGEVNAVVFGGFDGRVIAFTGDDGGTIRAWDPLTSAQLDLPIPKAQDWVTTLTYGELRGNPALAIGAADGTVRIWCGATQQTIVEVQLHATPQDMVIHPDGYLCIGTKMGVVTLRIGADR
ncbi:MAG: caspase family protein [Pseudonocardiaceae bacterium]